MGRNISVWVWTWPNLGPNICVCLFYSTKDHIVMVNGVSMENAHSNYTIHILKTCGKTANVVSMKETPEWHLIWHIFLLSDPLHLSICRLWNAPARYRSQRPPGQLGLPPIPTCWIRTRPDVHGATLTEATTETTTVPVPAATRRTAVGMETHYRWCHQGTRGCHIRTLPINPSELH